MPYLKKAVKQKNNSNKRKERQDIYNTTRWKKLREVKLMEQPLCEVCLAKGIVTVGEDIHHIISFLTTDDSKKRIQLAFDYNNLQTVCKVCHQQLHNSR